MAHHLSSRDFAAQVLLTASASTYAIIAGNTGSGSAGKLRVSFEQLSAANAGVNWNILQTGQTMHLPDLGGGTQRYTVLGGDAGFAVWHQLRPALCRQTWCCLEQFANWSGFDNPMWSRSGRGERRRRRDWSDSPQRFEHIGVDPVICYSGPAANFPSPASWQMWSLMWARNSGVIRINDAPQEVALIEQAITSVAQDLASTVESFLP